MFVGLFLLCWHYCGIMCVEFRLKWAICVRYIFFLQTPLLANELESLRVCGEKGESDLTIVRRLV